MDAEIPLDRKELVGGLPNEIWYDILDYLNLSESVPALFACKTWCGIAVDQRAKKGISRAGDSPIIIECFKYSYETLAKWLIVRGFVKDIPPMADFYAAKNGNTYFLSLIQTPRTRTDRTIYRGRPFYFKTTIQGAIKGEQYGIIELVFKTISEFLGGEKGDLVGLGHRLDLDIVQKIYLAEKMCPNFYGLSDFFTWSFQFGAPLTPKMLECIAGQIGTHQNMILAVLSTRPPYAGTLKRAFEILKFTPKDAPEPRLIPNELGLQITSAIFERPNHGFEHQTEFNTHSDWRAYEAVKVAENYGLPFHQDCLLKAIEYRYLHALPFLGDKPRMTCDPLSVYKAVAKSGSHGVFLYFDKMICPFESPFDGGNTQIPLAEFFKDVLDAYKNYSGPLLTHILDMIIERGDSIGPPYYTLHQTLFMCIRNLLSKRAAYVDRHVCVFEKAYTALSPEARKGICAFVIREAPLSIVSSKAFLPIDEWLPEYVCALKSQADPSVLDWFVRSGGLFPVDIMCEFVSQCQFQMFSTVLEAGYRFPSEHIYVNATTDPSVVTIYVDANNSVPDLVTPLAPKDKITMLAALDRHLCLENTATRLAFFNALLRAGYVCTPDDIQLLERICRKSPGKPWVYSV